MSNVNKLDIENQEVDKAQLSVVIGVSQKRIEQLVQEGIIATTTRKNARIPKFYLGQAVKGYVGYLKKTAKTVSSANYEKERARKMKNEAELKQMEVEKRKGQIVERSECLEAFKDQLTLCRQKLLSMPTKLAVDIIQCETAPEAKDLLTKEIIYCLSDLKADMESFVDQFREPSSADDNGDTKAAEPDITG